MVRSGRHVAAAVPPTPSSAPCRSGGGFEAGDIRWFADGQLNVSYNCLDRHIAAGRGETCAIIFEGDEPTDVRRYTYAQVLAEVCRVANVLLAAGVRRGDSVAVYLPMIPDLAFVMLACARIGAVHSVVFAGFSADSLRDRINDARSKWVVTADQGLRGGRPIPLKATTDAAVAACPSVVSVFVYTRTGAAVPMQEGRDLRMEPLLAGARPFCAAAAMDAEDTLFLLYTSGSTVRVGAVRVRGGAAARCAWRAGRALHRRSAPHRPPPPAIPPGQAQGRGAQHGGLPPVRRADAQVCL